MVSVDCEMWIIITRWKRPELKQARMLGDDFSGCDSDVES